MTDNTVSMVGPSDIAELAKVTRGAVSNWRKREASFPPPVGGTDSNPLFDLREIRAWLASRGTELVLDPAAQVWTIANTLRGNVDPYQLGETVLVLACVYKLIGRNSPRDVAGSHIERGLAELHQSDLFGDFDLSVVERIGSHFAQAIFDSFDLVPDSELPIVVDSVLERSSRAYGKAGAGWGFVGSSVSSMLATLAADEAEGHPGTTCLDPASGIGETLLQFADRRRGTADILIGQDVSRNAVSVARQRAYLRARPATALDASMFTLSGSRDENGPSVRFEIRDQLRFSPDAGLDTQAAIVVAEPPFGVRLDAEASSRMLLDPRYEFGSPPRRSADFAWLQLCVARLASGGVGFVVAVPGTLFRGGVERDIRREMLRRGCVRAIVQLPAKMYPHTAIPLVLWVVQPPTDSLDDVLLIDASSTADPDVAVPSWIERGEVPAAVPHRVVAVSELIADDVNLSVARWTEQSVMGAEAIAEAHHRGLEGLREASGELTRIIDGLATAVPSRHTTLVTIGELVQRKWVDVAVARAGTATDVAREDSSRITSRNVREGVLPPEPLAGSESEMSHNRALPGDVMIITWNQVAALVVPDGESYEFGTGVHRVRVLTPELDPRYLAAVVVGSWNSRLMSGATIQRVPVKDLEVPLLPLGEQVRLADELAEVMALRRTASDAVMYAQQLADSLLDSLRYGDRLSGDPMKEH